MKNKIKPSILSGFMELTPDEQLLFDDLLRKMIAVYEKNGCLPIDTPIIEKEEILLAKSEGEIKSQVYRIDKEKTKQVLRFDLTVPFARYVVQHMNALVFPFKRYQVGKVYRGERNQKGRYREFYQLDLDIINPNQLDIKNDAWVMSLAAQAFESIKLEAYQFQISNRKILSGVLGILDITNQQEIMILIDKYDKMGRASCLKSIEEWVGSEKSKKIDDLLNLSGQGRDVIQKLLEFKDELMKWEASNAIQQSTDELCMNDYKEAQKLVQERDCNWVALNQGIAEIKDVIETLDIFGMKKENYEVNLKIIRGLDYYTGTIFETVIRGNEQYGSICSGGRYDNLAELYTDNKIPGVGISVGITRLFFVLKSIGFFEKLDEKTSIDFLIIPIGETLSQCVETNKYLQSKGYKTEIYLNGGTLKKQLAYANAKKISRVVIIGASEVEESVVIVKDMVSGGQEKVVLDRIL